VVAALSVISPLAQGGWGSFPSPAKGAGHLLDIGCNEGRGLVLYAQNGFQAEGLELNENAAAVARAKGFRVMPAALERLAPAEPFDVVVLSNVIEHLPDPVAALQTVHRLLRPGGQVWISCPNGNSLWRRVFGRRWINYHVPFHLWHFSPDTLREILTRADFRDSGNSNPYPAIWLTDSLCGIFGNRQGRPNKVDALRSGNSGPDAGQPFVCWPF